MLLTPSYAVPPDLDQPYLVDVWQTEDGLPQNIVNAIAQTPDGYLWCGTTHGLARFDGVHFTVFNARNTPELGSARIRQLMVDRSGVLWATVFEGGLVAFKNGRFTAFAPPPRESMGRTIIGIAEDQAGSLWLTVEDGAVLHFANGEFTLVSKEWEAGTRTVFQVADDRRSQPWVTTTSSRLARIERDKLVTVLQGKGSEYEFLCPSRSGGYWIQTGGRVRLWNDGKWIADAGEWLPPERRVECSLEDRSGRVWVASLGKGVFCYSTNAVARQLTTKDGLGSDLVRGLFEDAEGNIWLGTRAGGLNRLRPALFRTYSRKDGLSSDLVTAICEGKEGELWVGTDGDGVNLMDTTGIHHFDKDQGLAGGHNRSLLLDTKGTLWAGSWPDGLFRFERGGFVPARDAPGMNRPLASLLEDSQGRLWLGQRTLNQLVWIENGTGHSVEMPNSSPSLDVVALAEAADGSIWIGTDGNGLFRWQNNQCRRFTHPDGLPSHTIRSLLADRDGSLWIGTLDGGLSRYKNEHFVTCTTRDGLLDDVINCILDDGRGFFWFTSFRGVFRVNKTELNEFADGKRQRIQCEAYGKSDGLPALECPGGFQPAGCKSRDGRLWFPTIKGVAVVDPAHVPTNLVAPPVLVEEMIVDGETIPSERRQAKAGPQPSLRIPPGQHRYEFRYTGLNFSAPERVRFRHRLDGVDKRWIEAGAERTVNYSHLQPGDYQFHVTACNQAGLWNEAGATVAFTVLPHFWETWWFVPAVGLLGAATIGGAVSYGIRRKLKRQVERLEMQLSVERERARIAQDIHDGVGANLTEIAWLAEVAEHDAAKPDEVRAQARKISATARATVESFDEIVWAVLPENDTLSSLIEYLGRRVDELFDSTATRCWFSAPPDLPDIVVPAEVRHSFYLACKETLHNVNKHAAATEVRVRVTVEDWLLRVDIEDNGRGFDPTTERPQGNGLRNLRQRFDALGGRFTLSSQPGKGTKVSMTIPLKLPQHR
jgi:signal transduction histidine kinase/ligand-binding sensor domain-containing protein